jgi:hypothetical protein
MENPTYPKNEIKEQSVIHMAIDCSPNPYPPSTRGALAEGQFEREVYRLEIVDGHMIAHLAGALALVDTGAPLSLGTGRSFVVLGKTRQPPTSFTKALRTASRELGREIDWIIGNDILGLSTVVLDWRGKTITFGGEAAVVDSGQSISVDGCHTVPVIKFGVAGWPVRAFLDTGAWLSYASPRAVAGLRSVRTERDFHPHFGEFETEVYRLAIQVGERAIDTEFGVLPARQRAFLKGTDGWVLGSDFFRERRIIFDYPNGRVIDCPSR